MSGIHCHRCGTHLSEGSIKYQVEISVRSIFDGVVPDSADRNDETEIERLIRDMSSQPEEELTRQVFEDDVFVVCPRCKEALLKNIYAHLNPAASPDQGRAHVIH